MIILPLYCIFHMNMLRFVEKKKTKSSHMPPGCRYISLKIQCRTLVCPTSHHGSSDFWQWDSMLYGVCCVSSSHQHWRYKLWEEVTNLVAMMLSWQLHHICSNLQKPNAAANEKCVSIVHTQADGHTYNHMESSIRPLDGSRRHSINILIRFHVPFSSL